MSKCFKLILNAFNTEFYHAKILNSIRHLQGAVFDHPYLTKLDMYGQKR